MVRQDHEVVIDPSSIGGPAFRRQPDRAVDVAKDSQRVGVCGPESVRGLVICIEACIDRGECFVHRLDQREARQVVDQHLVVDVSDDIDIGGPAAAEPSLQVLRCNPEKCQPAVANPEVERHRVQKEGGDRAPARIPLVWTVALLVGWSEAVGGSGTVQRRDAGATNGQRDAAREVSIGLGASDRKHLKCEIDA